MSQSYHSALDPRFDGEHTRISNPKGATLVDPNQRSGYDVYITEHARQTMIYLTENTTKLDLVKRAIMELSALPRSLDSYQRKNGIDVFTCKIGLRSEYLIEYAIHSGAVTIYSFSFAGDALKIQQKSEKPQLYRLQKSNGAWVINLRNPPKVDEIKTAHAAVNGQSNDLQKAAWLMGAHLESRYGALQEYTLFHNPTHYLLGGLGDTWESMRDKLGMTTQVTKEFTKVIDKAQQQGNSVKWLAHSQGAVIFAEAARLYQNTWSKHEHCTLDKHSVVFNSGAINIAHNKSRFDKLNIKFNFYNAPDDMVPQILGSNALVLIFKAGRAGKVNREKVIRSIKNAKDVYSGTTTKSSHTLPYNGTADRNNKVKNGLQTPNHDDQIVHDQAIATSNHLNPNTRRVAVFRFYDFMKSRRG